MAFRLHCDRCLRMIEVVDAKKVKELASTGAETVCKRCQRTETEFNSIIESLKKQVLEKTAILEKEMKDKLGEELKKVAEQNRVAG